MLRSAFLRIPLNCNWAATRFDMGPRRKAAAQVADKENAESPQASTRPRRKAATASKLQSPEDVAGDEAGASEPKRTRRKATTATPSEGAAASDEAVPKAKRAKKPAQPERPRYSESLRPPAPTTAATRLLSWNVGGLRGLMKKDADAMTKLLDKEKSDIICLQEIKISEKDVAQVTASLKLQGWHAYWNCSTAKAGYAGVATLCREEPLSITKGIGHEVDNEGRVVVTEHPGFWLVNTYTPNSSTELVRLSMRTQEWDPALSKFCKGLEAQGKPVILAGDLNCAREEIDIHNPKTNLKSAGFTPEERASFKAVYMDQGFVDTFRAQYPGHIGYTYFSHRFNARSKFMGWRLDYFLVSSTLAPRCHDAFILMDWPGSDHVPLGLILTQD